MSKSLNLTILCTIFCCAADQTFALTHSQSDCMDDAFRLCGEEIPFISEIEDCLESNMSQLSAKCRKEFSGPEPRSLLREEDFQ
jgi:hypothetical protein